MPGSTKIVGHATSSSAAAIVSCETGTVQSAGSTAVVLDDDDASLVVSVSPVSVDDVSGSVPELVPVVIVSSVASESVVGPDDVVGPDVVSVPSVLDDDDVDGDDDALLLELGPELAVSSAVVDPPSPETPSSPQPHPEQQTTASTHIEGKREVMEKSTA